MPLSRPHKPKRKATITNGQGSKSEINLADLTKIVIDALERNGFKELRNKVASRSGLDNASPEFKKCVQLINSGNWDEATQTTETLHFATTTNKNRALMAIAHQWFLELLESGEKQEAVSLLRNHVFHLSQAASRDLAARLFTDQVILVHETRQSVIEALEQLVAPECLVPVNRLCKLINDAKTYEKEVLVKSNQVARVLDDINLVLMQALNTIGYHDLAQELGALTDSCVCSEECIELQLLVTTGKYLEALDFLSDSSHSQLFDGKHERTLAAQHILRFVCREMGPTTAAKLVRRLTRTFNDPMLFAQVLIEKEPVADKDAWKTIESLVSITHLVPNDLIATLLSWAQKCQSLHNNYVLDNLDSCSILSDVTAVTSEEFASSSKSLVLTHLDQVWTACFNPAGTYLATGTRSGDLSVFKIKSGPNGGRTCEMLVELHKYHAAGIQAMDWCGDHLILTGSADGYVQLYDVNLLKDVTTIKTRSQKSLDDGVGAVLWVRNTETFFTGDYAKNLRLWNYQGNMLWSHEGIRVMDLALIDDSRLCVLSAIGRGNAQYLYIFDIKDFGYADEFKLTTGHQFTSLDVSPDSRYLLFSEMPDCLKIWDTRLLTETNLQGPTQPEFTIKSAFAGPKFVVSGSEDRKGWLFNRYTGQVVRKFAGHEGTINVVAYCNKSKLLATASDDQTVQIFSPSPWA